jgi:magnesium-transporting ATPase (P-type)
MTGDNPYTAISIAHSAGLIDNSYIVILINCTLLEEINLRLLECLDDKIKKLCLAVTGDSLTIIQNPENISIKSLFTQAIEKAINVICSRVSPKQKSDLILLIKERDKHKSILAIGDGANDVNMINAADVGVGITGKEGQQAARASDYVIGKFCFLRRLMLVHGRESYRKTSFAVGYILWKNFLYVLPIIL